MPPPAPAPAAATTQAPRTATGKVAVTLVRSRVRARDVLIRTPKGAARRRCDRILREYTWVLGPAATVTCLALCYPDHGTSGRESRSVPHGTDARLGPGLVRRQTRPGVASVVLVRGAVLAVVTTCQKCGHQGIVAWWETG